MATAKCRLCGDSIVWGRGNRGWLPIDPASLAEHVLGDDNKPIFDPRLGHERHRCSTGASASRGAVQAQAPVPAPPRPTDRDAMRAEFVKARDALDEAIRQMDAEVADAAR